ncbi:MAG: cytochrome c-type biogenesis protein CcmH [SAR86 cluster bacterium]|uniref:Cytochrome c-type biogenesis protein n=1 Tax=SAR86 cluster bacterium TaxID=2030880 RepID=A0A2A4XE21_9GAMM|nr:MAG: cytochrome c-type biogenesis protein CcmH [SAR86 cluster bacterium]
MNSTPILQNRTMFLAVASIIVLLGSLLLPSATYSQVDTFEFDTEEQQNRFRTLSDELRCPMCQNSSLSGSTGGVAEDLRREIHRMIMEGRSDSEIIQFMFERYGDFILFRPRLTAGTVLLWFGPLLFLLIGGLIAFGIWRRARKISDSDTELNKSQQERLQQLLGDKT